MQTWHAERINRRREERGERKRGRSGETRGQPSSYTTSCGVKKYRTVQRIGNDKTPEAKCRQDNLS